MYTHFLTVITALTTSQKQSPGSATSMLSALPQALLLLLQ
jgi:hypothetical protein